MKIYLDVAIITNAVVTLICLEATAALCHKKLGNKRSFIAAGFGGLTSLLIVFNAISYTAALTITIIKLISFPLIVLTAFGYKRLTELIKATLIFTAAKILYAGIVLILWEMSDTRIIYIRNYTIYFNISILKLTVSVILTYSLLTVIEIIKKASVSASDFAATYSCGNYQLTVPAVADTGNKLRDCFSNEPVVIFFCDELYYHYNLDSPDSLGPGKFRLIPFDTINGNGLLAVTYSGKIEITADDKRYTDIRCCIGIKRSGGSRSRAIFNPEIIR
jgi:stage II sporulation protein GA (sporulation sigma-E factor processing peptidase)